MTMPTKTLKKPVKDGAYIVEWAKFVGSRERPRLQEWVLDVGKIKGDWFHSSDGKTKKRVSSDYFIVKRRLRSESVYVPTMDKKKRNGCVCMKRDE